MKSNDPIGLEEWLHKKPGETPRFHFRRSSTTPDMAEIIDLNARSVMCAWPMDMAMMLSMMYENLANAKTWAVADEFMYGLVLGHTYTLLNADKMPKVERKISEDGLSVSLKVVMPDGSTTESNHDVNDVLEGKFAEETLNRVGLKVEKGDPATNDPDPPQFMC